LLSPSVVLVVIGAAAAAAGGALYYVYPVRVSQFAGLTRSYLLSFFAPPGSRTTESNPAYEDAGAGYALSRRRA
jgi:hypothetical protein